MKKTIFFMAAGAMLLGFTACDDVLDIDPTDRYSAQTVWSSQTSADQYLLGLYTFITANSGNCGTDDNMTAFDDAYSDLVKSSSWNQYGHPYNMTMLEENAFDSNSAGTFECWTDCYTRIRRCNEFLSDAQTYGPNISETYAATRSGEARFIRAMAYFKLMKIYGKCILRDAVDGPEENDKALATPDEIWDFIIADLTYAGENIAENLDHGRITRAAAWAYLSRVALYAQRWDTVISAAQKCRECGGALDASYANVFSDMYSVENLLTVEFQQNKLSHRADYFFRPIGDAAVYNTALTGAFNPTSELVDSYEMADGTEFSWDLNGDDPYTGREPRFYATILYNGCRWEGRTLETYEGGADGIAEFNVSGAAGSTVTGYYMRKFITENETGWDLYGSDHFAIVIRYAEVLLNEAEAYAMKSQLEDASAAMNQVRARVGLPARTASTQDEFMAQLRHERVVELAGEGQRFWDLRRWKLAYCEDSEESVIDGKNFHGCLITKQGDGSFTYEQIVCDGTEIGGTDYMKHFFPERYYAFALPIDEISNNALVTVADQNYGW